MPRSLYDMTKQEVEAVDDMLRALVHLNYHASAAWDAGWEVRFALSEDGTKVSVTVNRDVWPTPSSEAEPDV